MTAPAKATLANVPLELLTLPAFPSVSAKALHLLAPSFLPIWDDKIARAFELIL